jgi:hypothetical protein
MAVYIGRVLGDTNEDGKIDVVDIARVAKVFGQNVPPAPDNCDINMDGKIDARDLAIPCRHFGAYNTVVNSGFEDGMTGWTFHPGYKGSWGYPCGRAYRGKYGFCMGSDIKFGDYAFICSLSQQPLPATKNYLFTIAFLMADLEKLVIQPVGITAWNTHGGAAIDVSGIGGYSGYEFEPFNYNLLELRQGDDGRTVVYINNEKILEGTRNPITMDKVEILLYAIGEDTDHAEVWFDEVRVYRIV